MTSEDVRLSPEKMTGHQKLTRRLIKQLKALRVVLVSVTAVVALTWQICNNIEKIIDLINNAGSTS